MTYNNSNKARPTSIKTRVTRAAAAVFASLGAAFTLAVAPVATGTAYAEGLPPRFATATTASGISTKAPHAAESATVLVYMNGEWCLLPREACARVASPRG